MGTSQLIPDELWNSTPELIRLIVNRLLHHCQELDEGKLRLLQELDLIHASQVQSATEFALVARNRPRSEMQAVFICDVPTTRQAKLAFGLKESGWSVILLHKENPWFEVSRYYTASHRYSTPEHAVMLASLYSPEVYHCFSSWGFGTSKKMIEARPGKIVFDSYDIFAGCLQDKLAVDYQAQILDEKYCFENADGTCHRHSYAAVANRHLGYKIAKPIFFPEYCWNHDEERGFSKRPKRTDGIHCIYVGSLNPRWFEDSEKFISVIDIQFVRSLTDHGIHYHIYPFVHPYNESEFLRDFQPLLKEEAVNPFFHLHRPLPYEKLMEEISQYHFGIVCNDRRVIQDGDPVYKPVMHRSGTFNKVFDFLDADLIYVSYGWRNMERLTRGACLQLERLTVGNKLKTFSVDDYVTKIPAMVSPVREKLSIRRQIPRLIEFYRSL